MTRQRTKTKLATVTEDQGDEINTVYGDLVTFIMMLFILLFVLSYNEHKNDDFFTQMNVKFGGKKLEALESTTTDHLLVSQLQNFIKKEDLDNFMTVLVDEQKVKLILSPTLLFNSGSASIKPKGKDAIKGLSGILNGVDNPVIIEGHTDNVPINTPEFESNWELSFHRALSVLKLLIAEGHNPEQFSAQGYGEYRPLADNTTAEGRAQNRRIEVNIIRITKAENNR